MRHFMHRLLNLFYVALLIGLWLTARPPIAMAHGSMPVTPASLWGDWSWEPLTLFLLFSGLIVYDTGIKRLWSKSGRGHGIRLWQTLAFKAGLLTLFVALISPLDAMSAALFSVHMMQHILLLFIAAPLLMMSGAPLAFLWALPLTWRRRVSRRWQRAGFMRQTWKMLTQPLPAWILYAVALWLWHLPGFYQAALGSGLIHALEHLSFLMTSSLFWWILIRPSRHRAQDYGVGILYVFTTALHSSILGALLVFSSQPWYPAYAATVAPWGILPLADQQLAGLIMWLPIGVLYLGAAAALVILWLHAVETAMVRHDRPATRLTQPEEALISGSKAGR